VPIYIQLKLHSQQEIEGNMRPYRRGFEVWLSTLTMTRLHDHGGWEANSHIIEFLSRLPVPAHLPAVLEVDVCLYPEKSPSRAEV